MATLKFDCRELTVLMKHMTRRRQWQLALHTVLQRLSSSGIRPDLLLLNTMASSYAAGDDWKRCCQLLEDFRAAGFKTDVFTIGAVLKAAVKCKKWKEALLLAKDETSIEITNNLIGSLTTRWPLALMSLDHCRSFGLSLSHASSVAATSLFREDWERALLFARQGCQSCGYVETLNSTLSACETWDRVLVLLMSASNSGLQTDTISFSCLASACEKDLRWRWALQTLEATQARHIFNDRTFLNAVISAQEKGSTWSKAVALTMQMRRFFGCEPNVVSFNSASSACEKAYRWTSSIQLFDWAQEKNVEVDTISGNALLAACRNARRWCEVLELLRVFFFNDIFLDDLALRMALETQLDLSNQRGEQAVELMASMDRLWINVLSRKISQSWQGDFG